MGSWRSGGAGECRTGDTGTVEADEPWGPDEAFKPPEPEDDDDCVAAGFSTWADSAERRKPFHQQRQSHKSILTK